MNFWKKNSQQERFPCQGPWAPRASSEGGGESESETEQGGHGGKWGERVSAVALGGENSLKKRL